MTYLGAIKTFGPWVAILLLIGGILFMRGNLIEAKADRDKAQAAVAELAAINKANDKAMSDLKAAQLLNDTTVLDLNTKLLSLQTSAMKKRDDIKKVLTNDPKSKLWADVPLPDELRNAIN
jgi:hypothetical protein